MKLAQFSRFHFAFGALLAALCLLPGCGGGSGSSGMSSPSGFRSPVTLNLVTYRDPWAASRPRFWDIDDRPFDDFLAKGFSYARANVELTYDAAPETPFFKGHLRASGLKPNFSYQLKLAGKPRDGARGWGNFGDDVANERIGRIGRWWDDENQFNATDSYFDINYKNATPATRTSVYGYHLMAIAVTDSDGNVDVDFDGSGSFHVTWQDKQSFGKDFEAGTFPIGSEPPFYGYGHDVADKNIKLWLEREPGRPVRVSLPKGRYNVRFILTEDSFHNNFGGTSSAEGGLWQTVLANEDFSSGQPDSNPNNDIQFEIT